MTAGPVGAAIDLGSTSIHLLVAGIGPAGLTPLADESAFLGLGAAATGPGLLGAAGRRLLATTVAGFAERARSLGAETVTVVGTEPLRRLADAARIVAEIAAAARVPVHVLGHDEEGWLTLAGVTDGRPADRPIVVADIGGGSTEIVVAGPGRPAEAFGLRLGAAGLTAAIAAHDPATPDEHLALAGAAAAALAGLGPGGSGATELILVGGTASNLAKLVAPDRILDRERLIEARSVLAAGPAESVAAARGLRAARVRLLPAGAAIVEALLGRFGVERARVSEAGIREGLVRVVDRDGPAWRDRVRPGAG